MPEPFSLTTKELAARIVEAVKDDLDEGCDGIHAVLETLREHGCWFCVKTETDQGTVQTVLPWGE